MAEVEQAPASISKKERSPSFPFITLTKALEKARAVYGAAKRHEARMADVATAIGLGAKSSATLQTVAALIAYGLLDDSGSGDARKFRISDLGFKALEDQRPGAKEAALREAALKPKVIAEYAETWRDGRPADPICISELRIERGFTEDGAKAFLRVFDDALSYAAPPKSDKNSDSKLPPDGKKDEEAPKIDVGDFIQWETGGVLGFDRPKAVRAIQDREGEVWVFVEGSETGIPMEEAILDQKAQTRRSPPPMLPLQREQQRADALAEVDLEIDRFTVDEGVVRIEFPKEMGIDSVDELEQFFQLFIKKAKRRAAAN